MKDIGTLLKESRSATGRAYRSIGNAMSQLSPTADQNALHYAVAQLDAAALALRSLLLAPTPTPTPELGAGEREPSEASDWYFVDYSLPRSRECPTGRANVRLKALSQADAIHRAATLLDAQGLGLVARMNHARKDEAP